MCYCYQLTAILEATGILRLISGMLRTFLELAAYCSVEMVSSRLMEAGDTVAMIDVFVLPPKESCRSRVSFDSLEKTDKMSVKLLSDEITTLGTITLEFA